MGKQTCQGTTILASLVSLSVAFYCSNHKMFYLIQISKRLGLSWTICLKTYLMCVLKDFSTKVLDYIAIIKLIYEN